jgi:hypothetical protein
MLKLIQTTYRNSGLVAVLPHYTYQSLNAVWEIAVFPENYLKPINALRGQARDFLNVVHMVNIELKMVVFGYNAVTSHNFIYATEEENKFVG